MRYFLLIFGSLMVLVMLIAGQRGSISRRTPIEVFPDMDRQPKVRPQTRYAFFDDDRSSRLQVLNTVARSRPHDLAGRPDLEVYPYEDHPVNTGRLTGTTNFLELNPVPVTEQLMARGRERYQIFCSPCHGLQGDGNGITRKYGMGVIANLHDARIVKLPDGDLFSTITFGKGQMGAYGAAVTVPDRWAIIAYLRALHRSRLALSEELPPAVRSRLGAAAGGGATNAPQPQPAPAPAPPPNP